MLLTPIGSVKLLPTGYTRSKKSDSSTLNAITEGSCKNNSSVFLFLFYFDGHSPIQMFSLDPFPDGHEINPQDLGKFLSGVSD